MATDVRVIVANLLGFYDFGGKVMLSVGAGGGQLAEYGYAARRVIAVDPDPQALAKLAQRVTALGLDSRFELVERDFLAVSRAVDVVLFEFCLHELTEPEAALRHAAQLAPDVIVLDHAPGSPWAHCVDETEKVQRSWGVIDRWGTRAERRYEAVQSFATHGELVERVRSQGDEAIRRVSVFRSRSRIEIPMSYALAWLAPPSRPVVALGGRG